MSVDTETIQKEIVKLSPDTLVELYILDASDIDGDVVYFHAGTNNNLQPITFKGDIYQPLPVEVEGFVFNGKGEMPRPKVKVANLDGGISALCLAYQDMIGTKFIRRRTFARFLDGGDRENDLAQLPDDVFYVERKVSETKEVVEFELSSPLDVDGVMLPRRQFMTNQCGWKYRSAECSFAGDYLVADDTDAAMTGTNRGEWNELAQYNTNDFVWRYVRGRRFYYLALIDNIVGELMRPPRAGIWKQEVCSKRLTGCKLRYGQNAEYPFGGFPAIRKANG